MCLRRKAERSGAVWRGWGGRIGGRGGVIPPSPFFFYVYSNSSHANFYKPRTIPYVRNYVTVILLLVLLVTKGKEHLIFFSRLTNEQSKEIEDCNKKLSQSSCRMSSTDTTGPWRGWDRKGYQSERQLLTSGLGRIDSKI